MNGLHYRKSVRDAVVAALVADFNTNHAAIANDYGVTPLTFDFSNASRNFGLWNINPTEVELSPLLDLDPAGMAVYTEKAIDTDSIRGVRFDGAVLFCICGIYRPRKGAEGSDTESIMDAFEDAAMLTINQYQWPINSDVSLLFTRETSIERSKLMPLSDGFQQSFEIVGKVKVLVP